MKDHKIVKAIILQLIKANSKIGTKGFHQKHSDEHYLNKIFQILTYALPWRFLDDENTSYTTYYKQYKTYIKNNIFQQAYAIIIELLKKKHILNHNSLKDLFLDASMIKNINGSEKLGKNYQDRNRLGNKITVIVTKQGIPLAITIDKSNVHDTKMVVNTISKIKVKIIGSKIVADKGYVNKQLTDELKTTFNIRLVTPVKKGHKRKRLYKSDTELLGKRNIVENFFAWLKSNRRLRNRYDRSIKSFEGFLYLGMIKVISTKFFE